MIVMDLLSVVILGGVMLYVVRNELVTPSSKYNKIVGNLTSTVTKLEGLATKEEKKAEKFIQAHLLSKDVATKARSTASNIGNLFA